MAKLRESGLQIAAVHLLRAIHHYIRRVSLPAGYALSLLKYATATGASLIGRGDNMDKKVCLGCDYFYPVSELTAAYVHQYGESLLCGECLPKYGETFNA